MPRYESKAMERIKDLNAGTDIFKSERIEYDLSGMRFLWAGIDSIRQLYICNLRADLLPAIARHYEVSDSDVIDIGGYEWKLTSSGKKSGYKFIFKNLELGFVVLVKSMYKEADQRGPHIKIEATPQIIDHLGPQRLTKRLREIANLFGETIEANGLAVHLAVDMKGLELPEDFERKLVTHSRRSYKAHGIADISNHTISEMAVTYGKNETFMFGSPTSIQMCLYDKTLEALKSDKLAFCEGLWMRTPSIEDVLTTEYRDGSDGNEADQVKRLEFRIHHSIIREFENGSVNGSGKQLSIREPADLIKHLQALWDYCLNAYRLQHSATYLHPIWQKIAEDVRFAFLDGSDGWIYKRSQKKSADGPSRRNVAMWLGNVMKLSARKGLKPDYVVNQLLTSGLDSDLADYFGILLYGNTNELHHLLLEFVTDKMRDHRLEGVAA
ncbi:hypothetical protein [Oceanobacter mangrovi]|uniref:hypothetical protein n=1 Tax=Oceanobacter mangrovi TaxID=2862510 RepID=UPI001C8E4494|nr:hypothetical protein [Oceanobacter mangrovi]